MYAVSWINQIILSGIFVPESEEEKVQRIKK